MNSTIARLGATAAASLAVFAFATPAAQAAPDRWRQPGLRRLLPHGVG